MQNRTYTALAALALGASVAVASVCGAQPAGQKRPPTGQPGARPGVRPGGPGGAGFMQRMAEQLKLTEAQKTKLKPIFEAQQKEAMALRQNTSLSEDQRRTKMRAIFTNSQAKMKKILTAEQNKKLTEMLANLRNRGGPGGRPGGGPGARPGGTPR